MGEKLRIRPLRKDEWAQAMVLATRSFVNEPFMLEMFGVDPLPRFALAHRFYQSSPWPDEDLTLGAFVGGVLVGLCLSSRPGRCDVCEHIDPRRPPEDPLLYFEWQFEVNVQVAHADQEAHAWMRRVAVDPALRRAGIGRRLVAGAVRELSAIGVRTVLLECQPHREDLYVACGFRRVGSIPEPSGPDAALMRADL